MTLLQDVYSPLGLANAPKVFIGLFSDQDIGKTVVKVRSASGSGA